MPAAIRRAASRHRLAERLGSLAGSCRWAVRAVGHHGHHVPRQLDVARPTPPHHRGQHPVDLPQGRVRIVQFGLGQRSAEHLRLGLELLHPMVQQRVGEPLAHARCAADDHHRRLFGVGPGNRVAQAQPPHAIRHADGADAVDAGVGVGREAAQSSRVQPISRSWLCSNMP